MRSAGFARLRQSLLHGPHVGIGGRDSDGSRDVFCGALIASRATQRRPERQGRRAAPSELDRAVGRRGLQHGSQRPRRARHRHASREDRADGRARRRPQRTGLAVRVDHAGEAQVEALRDRIRREQGRLDVLVNDVGGGDELVEFGRPFWKQSPSKGRQMLERGLFTHLVTSRHAVPRDRARPGHLRPEAMLDRFGVTEANWRDGAVKDPNFLASESRAYLGRAVVALAADPLVGVRAGRVFSSWVSSGSTASPTSTAARPGASTSPSYGRACAVADQQAYGVVAGRCGGAGLSRRADAPVRP